MRDPRNERQAYAEMVRGLDVRPAKPQQSRIAEFVDVFRQYRRHGIVYAAKRAYGVAFRGLPF